MRLIEGGGTTSDANSSSTSPSLPADAAPERSVADAGKCTPDDVKNACFRCLGSACCTDLLACRDDKGGCLTFLTPVPRPQRRTPHEVLGRIRVQRRQVAEELAACALSGNVCRTACVD